MQVKTFTGTSHALAHTTLLPLSATHACGHNSQTDIQHMPQSLLPNTHTACGHALPGSNMLQPQHMDSVSTNLHPSSRANRLHHKYHASKARLGAALARVSACRARTCGLPHTSQTTNPIQVRLPRYNHLGSQQHKSFTTAPTLLDRPTTSLLVTDSRDCNSNG